MVILLSIEYHKNVQIVPYFHTSCLFVAEAIARP